MKPKYKMVYDSIREKILREEYQASERIEDGETLAQLYGCSVLTIKKALDLLALEGYVVRRRGVGTFVKKLVCSKPAKTASGINAYYTMHRDIIRPHVTSHVESFEIIKCGEDMARNLNIPEGEFVYSIVRVRMYDRQARIAEYTWMPIQLIPGLEMKHLQSSIYGYIIQDLKLKIQGAHISINAVRPNELEKKHFSMTDQDFVCEVKQTAYLDHAEIFEYSIAHHIPEYFEFETNVIKELS